MKYIMLCALVVSISCTHINAMDLISAMDLTTKQGICKFADHLRINVLIPAEAETKKLMKSTAAQQGYTVYLQQTRACFSSVQPTKQQQDQHLTTHLTLHLGSICSRCQTAFDQADPATKRLIVQKGFEDEVRCALADILDHLYTLD